MKCQQCLSPRGEIAEYRVYSDVINVKVCLKCADKARVIGLKTTRIKECYDRQETDLEDAA